MLAMVSQIALVVIFLGGILLQVFLDFSSLEEFLTDDSGETRMLAVEFTGFRSTDQIVGVMIVCTIAIVLLLVLMLFSESYFTAQRTKNDERWSCVLLEPPHVKWLPRGKYAAFLSHYKVEAAADARYMHGVRADIQRG